MCLFEYDEKREKELIRKAEFQEGVKDSTKRMIQALQLIQKKCSPNEIEQETDLSPETVEDSPPSTVSFSSTHFSRPLIPAITIKNQKNSCLQFISIKLSANSTSTAAHCA